jgi:hypothetical protein
MNLLERHFKSQRSKHWFDVDTFRGLARLRGNECRAAGRYAEAFYSRKHPRKKTVYRIQSPAIPLR